MEGQEGEGRERDRGEGMRRGSGREVKGEGYSHPNENPGYALKLSHSETWEEGLTAAVINESIYSIAI